MTDFRPTRFEILPMVIKNLIIINVLVFFAQSIGSQEMQVKLLDLFALHTWQSPYFKPWQFLTHMFMHGGFIHILFNMFALWTFGSILEGMWGPKRFLTFYLVCGLGAALCHTTVLYFETEKLIHIFNTANGAIQEGMVEKLNTILVEPTLGASGAVFGCLAAFGYLFPNTPLYLIFIPVPIKAKWLIGIYALYELVLAVRNSAGDDVAHVAHLGGALVGFLLVYFWNKANKKTFY